MKEKLAEIGTENICVIAIVEKDGKVLQGHRHYTPDKWKQISVWTSPGGRCDEGETIEQALRRETEEETGITDLNICGFIGSTPGSKEGDHLLIFYATTSQEPQLMEPEKFSEWKWTALEEFMQEPLDGVYNPAARKLVCDFFRVLVRKGCNKHCIKNNP